MPMLYHGWMYAPYLMLDQQAALALLPGQQLAVQGFVLASADPGRATGAPVVLAIHGSALDLSELNGYPPGTLLMVSPGTRYAVAGVGWDPSSPGSVRITLTE